jgi:hypothetical protein
MKKKYFLIFSGLIFLLSGHCMAETVSMPLTVDYPLLRALAVYQAFAEPNETATILDEKDGCNRVTLSQPTFEEENSRVRFETRIHIRLGKPMGEYCLMPIEWEGYLVFYQRPRINPASWTLSFETLDSKVYDLNRQPANISQTLLEIISTHAYDYLNGIRVDLAPPVSELKFVFSQFFQPAVKERSMKMLQSIRPGKAHVNAHAVEIDILMDVEQYYAKREEKRERIPDEKREQFFDQWEAWDAFLVHMLSTLAPEPLSSGEHQILLDTLLETRHRFVAGLTNKNLENDFVREQFVAAWKKLAPIFRNHLADRPTKALLGYLAFFTASDALSALDKIGPVLEIEISRNGLVRLVRLLSDQESEGESDVLAYRAGVNIQLRDVLGLGPPPPALGPAFDADALDLIDRHESQVDINSFADAIGSFFCKPAWAKQKKTTDSLTEIKTWLFSRDNLDTYIDRTQSLLMDSARDTLKKHKNSNDYKEIFPLVVLSTAWQESCFRQFLVKHKKIVYLRSYNGSSVGLMQINERVWRGMYDPHHLRWDIRYNALAGCEIIDLYVTKYLAKHAKNRKALVNVKDETRAGIIYAMYNGGPGQLDKFLSRSAKGKLYDSDKLFLEKYVWVKNGQLTNINKCLIGQ